MAWSLSPSGQTRIRDLRSEVNYEFAGTDLTTEISGTLITPTSMADYTTLVGSTGITGTSGYVLTCFDHFDVRADGTTPFSVGETPFNVTVEATAKTTADPRPHWWAPARGNIANLPVPAPGDPRLPEHLYQIRSASVLGLGMIHIPGTVTAQSSMQTQRRSATGVPPVEWGEYDFDANVSFSAGYCYRECRMRTPYNPGSWCGFWSINEEEYDSPMYPRIELDDVEEYTSPAITGGTYAHHFTPWLHRPTPAVTAPGFNVRDIFPSEYQSIYEVDGVTPVNFTVDFHLIGTLFTPDWIICYYNRKEIHRRPMLNEWKKNHYLILSHQAQAPFYQTSPNNTAWFEVDYVMVWEHPTVAATLPARSTPYSPPAFNPSTRAISVQNLEKAVAQKWGIQNILPAGHPGLTIDHSDPSVAPIMPDQLRKTLANNKSAGYSFGTCAVTNSPTRTPLYAARGADAADFNVNLNTGEITLKVGATLDDNRVYDFGVVASTIPPTPTVLGRHATRVLLDMRPDDDFDFRYFDRNLFKQVYYWLDASSDTYYDLDGSNNVEAVYDRSTYGRGDAGFAKSVQADAARRPGFSATGINGNPAFEGRNSSTNMKVPAIIGSDVFGNMVVRATDAISVSVNGTKQTVNSAFALNTPTVLLVEVKGDGVDATVDTVSFTVNGVPVAMSGAFPQTNVKGTISILTVFQARSLGGSSLGRIYDATGGFFNNVVSGTGAWFDGFIGLWGLIYDPTNTGLSTEERNKLVGYGHWQFGLESSLPVDHPYRSVRPKMWN